MSLTPKLYKEVGAGGVQEILVAFSQSAQSLGLRVLTERAKLDSVVVVGVGNPPSGSYRDSLQD